jgi:hypothetical protein
MTSSLASEWRVFSYGIIPKKYESIVLLHKKGYIISYYTNAKTDESYLHLIRAGSVDTYGKSKNFADEKIYNLAKSWITMISSSCATSTSMQIYTETKVPQVCIDAMLAITNEQLDKIPLHYSIWEFVRKVISKKNVQHIKLAEIISEQIKNQQRLL